jgi:hypothetical protein
MNEWMNLETTKTWTSKSLNPTCKRVFQQSHLGSTHMLSTYVQGFLLTHLLIQNIFGEWMFSNPSFYTTTYLLERVVRVFGLQGYIWGFRFLWPRSELTLFDWNWAQELDCEIIYLFIYWLNLEPKIGIVEKKTFLNIGSRFLNIFKKLNF